MTKFHIFAPRRYAAMYLQWELGTQRANKFMRTLPKDDRGWVDLGAVPLFRAKLKREATGHVNRICHVIAYQEGRLGKSLTGGGGIIEPTKATK